MRGNFDISSVPKDGYLIFPLSMSRLANAQSGQGLYDFLVYFESKIKYISIDCILLYTNDLYLNSNEQAVAVRRRSLHQMLGHKGEFKNILLKERRYVPQAFHFLPWDYGTLNAEGFTEAKNLLLHIAKNNDDFQKCLLNDLRNQGREESDINIGFLIEEIAVTCMLTRGDIPLPHILATENGWRLICYPGNPISSLVYTYKNNLLQDKTKPSKDSHLFSRSFYNMEKKILIDFDTAEISQ
ncbi:MAG: hypothetical protein IPK84_02785 [Candidatus Moraniibacteriota bacterium]|nr:MAG: hypothetical protein IPK84_02785 [Candidatus Moranbacteria bacterium]